MGNSAVYMVTNFPEGTSDDVVTEKAHYTNTDSKGNPRTGPLLPRIPPCLALPRILHFQAKVRNKRPHPDLYLAQVGFSEESRPTLGPTQSPVQRVAEALNPGVYAAGTRR
jgi:hypothetical protein